MCIYIYIYIYIYVYASLSLSMYIYICIYIYIYIYKSAKTDRRQWLIDIAVSGIWSNLRLLWKGAPSRQGTLQSPDVKFVDSSLRADTFS